MYPKCDETKCKWHMGGGRKRYTYLNGSCYHSNGVKNMFCPKNKDSILNECDNPHCIDGVTGEYYGEKQYCTVCNKGLE